MSHILVVEDELKLANLEIDYLHNAGFETDHLKNGLEVVPWFKQKKTDLVLLDLMLPGCDGLDVCRELRSFTTVPIMMVTARIEEIDRLLGLELGADDYICKPFSPRELVARIKAMLRRVQIQSQPYQGNNVTKLTLDPHSLRVCANGQEIELTKVEYFLLETLYQQPGHIFTRQKLMNLIYEDQRIVSDRTIDSHIKKLRKKLAELQPNQELITSVYGAGYRYDPNRLS